MATHLQTLSQRGRDRTSRPLCRAACRFASGGSLPHNGIGFSSRVRWSAKHHSCSARRSLSVPVYQYACTECGEQLEVRQSFTDDALTVCPACEGRLRKVLSAVGVVFKGSGFYRTDSRAAATASNGPTVRQRLVDGVLDRPGRRNRRDEGVAPGPRSRPGRRRRAATGAARAAVRRRPRRPPRPASSSKAPASQPSVTAWRCAAGLWTSAARRGRSLLACAPMTDLRRLPFSVRRALRASSPTPWRSCSQASPCSPRAAAGASGRALGRGRRGTPRPCCRAAAGDRDVRTRTSPGRGRSRRSRPYATAVVGEHRGRPGRAPAR